MGLVGEYRDARAQEHLARLRRLLTLRALVATGTSQREIAAALGVSQPAVSQQLKASREIADTPPEILMAAAAPVLVDVARSKGFGRLALFGSVARGQARPDSDVDLLVEAPPGTGIKEVVGLRELFQEILSRRVDLITYGGLKAGIDDDIRAEAVSL